MCPPSESIEHGAHALEVGHDVDRFRITGRRREKASRCRVRRCRARPRGASPRRRAESAGGRRCAEQLQPAGEHREQVVGSRRATPPVSWPSDRSSVSGAAPLRHRAAGPDCAGARSRHRRTGRPETVAVAIPQRVEERSSDARRSRAGSPNSSIVVNSSPPNGAPPLGLHGG